MKIVHIITGLPVGGAQTVLFQLVRHQLAKGWQVHVCSLTEAGEMGARIQDLGVDVMALNMSRSLPSPFATARLRGWLKRLQPDVVQTWLYHGDLFGGIAARLAGLRNIFWNLRQTDLDPAGSRRTTILTAKLCARLSRIIPRRIVCCAEEARRLHAEIGYDEGRMLVIGNGIDTERFKPEPSAGAAFRAEIGVSAETPLVGLVARFHPQKDHASFLSAAAQAQRARPDTVFIMCGEDVTPENTALAAMTAKLDNPAQVKCLGIRRDLAGLYSALDIAVSSSSFGEGFSNVIIEAMACGTPCVVTDVGDSHAIVGQSGWPVPRRDPDALAKALIRALSLAPAERAGFARAARQRVLDHYQWNDVFAAYDRLYAA